MSEEKRRPVGDEEATRPADDERPIRPPGDEAATRPDDDEAELRLTDEELEARLREEVKRIRVADVAAEVMVTLVTLGYQKMGLTSETLELRHLPDARLAIELLRGLIETVEREKAGDVAAFRSTLAAMQLQYARVAALPQGVLPGGEAAPSREAPAGSRDEAPAETSEADASQRASKLWVPPGARREDEAR